MVGVSCPEPIDPPKTWASEEEAFAASLAAMATLTLKAADRRQTQGALKQHVRERTGELRRMTAHLQTIIEESPLAMIELDQAGHVATWNAATTSLFGWTKEEVIGQELPYVPQGQERESDELWASVMSGGAPRGLELRRKRKDCTVIDVNMWGMLLQGPGGQTTGSIGLFIDVTERKPLEKQLRQAYKMEGIGRLAGGVARDFNNLLTVINGCATLVLEQLRAEDPLRRSLTEILAAGQRAAALTKQLLAFSRRQVLTFQVFDLNQVLSSISSMIERLIGEDIVPIRDLTPQPCIIRADRGQIDQVILNLAANAKDAMPHGGTLTLSTRILLLGEETPAPHPALLPGSDTHLSVRDSEMGMDRATLTHIFEPFFTTKEEGKGTGLGLVTVYVIVKQSQGFVFADSNPGEGTTFDIYFPSAEALPWLLHRLPPHDPLWQGTHPARGRPTSRAAAAHAGTVRLWVHPDGSLQRTGGAPARRRSQNTNPHPAHRHGDAADDGAGRGRAPQPTMAGAAGPVHVGICGRKRTADVSRRTGHRLHSEAVSPHGTSQEIARTARSGHITHPARKPGGLSYPGRID